MPLSRLHSSFCLHLLAFLALFSHATAFSAQTPSHQATPSSTQKVPSKQAPPPKPPAPEEELQQAITNAGSDRAALNRNLEAFLKKYPDSPQRPQIYRALVEACLQLRDTARAADYAERIVALTPDDMSITLLAIQLLERSADEAGLRRASAYATRVLEYVARSSADEKSPRISQKEWQTEKDRDQASVLLLRGRLHMKLKEYADAQKDFQASYARIPSSAAAEKLGELAELNKQLPVAIDEYARAFALADGANGTPTRRDIRQKLGNVWRLAHGSEAGLGELLLNIYDDVAQAAADRPIVKNASARNPLDFTLRTAPAGAPYPLADAKGKILVVNFWATWCGPCRALAPLFDRAAAQFSGRQDVVFLAANCDEDESLVSPYLDEEKPHTVVVFADGLERLLAVRSFPTVLILDAQGKIVYRTEGYSDESFTDELVSAVNRVVASQKAIR